MSDFESLQENINQHLDSSRQNWLLGAGISCMSNIPLMFPLTDRVKTIIMDSNNNDDIKIYTAISDDLPTHSHIEHYLSHLGDLIALAERSKNSSVNINNSGFRGDALRHLHSSIISAISQTVRYGYSKNGENDVIGSPENPIIEVTHHLKFIKALFNRRANLHSRSKITFLQLITILYWRMRYHYISIMLLMDSQEELSLFGILQKNLSEN